MTTPTTTLTREQAILIRALDHLGAWITDFAIFLDDRPDLKEFFEPYEFGTDPKISKSGREALAAYDATNVTIPNNAARLAVEALNYMADHRLVHEAFDVSMQDELESAWRAIEAALGAARAAVEEAAECSGEAKEVVG